MKTITFTKDALVTGENANVLGVMKFTGLGKVE